MRQFYFWLEGVSMKSTVLALALVACAAALPASAQVTVQNAWARATVPQQTSSGAYMQISTPVPAKLIAVSSRLAGTTQVHEMVMVGDVMKMRAVPFVDLPAGKTVEFGPGSYHVMLMDLKQQLKEGDTVPLALVVEGQDKKRQTIELKVPVRPLNASGGGHKH
jgi:copper(I)-binding protein